MMQVKIHDIKGQLIQIRKMNIRINKYKFWTISSLWKRVRNTTKSEKHKK